MYVVYYIVKCKYFLIAIKIIRPYTPVNRVYLSITIESIHTIPINSMHCTDRRDHNEIMQNGFVFKFNMNLASFHRLSYISVVSCISQTDCYQ